MKPNDSVLHGLLILTLSACIDGKLTSNEMIHIPIITQNIALVIRINEIQDPLVVYVGKRLNNADDYGSFSSFDIGIQNEDYTGIYSSVYTPAGGRNLLEPAIQVVHADGNPSLELKYIGHEQNNLDSKNNISLTKIFLKDPAYPFYVTVSFKSYYDTDIIEQWTQINHTESGIVRLIKYSSANLYFSAAESYYLTHFHGDWAQEMKPVQIPLTAGIKVLDSKLGTRTDLFQPPSFFISFNRPNENIDDDQGEIFSGTLSWSGNYQIQFEVDPLNNLRLIAGINPYASEYYLNSGTEFVTPSFLFTYSSAGLGTISRNWHRWARQYRIVQGQSGRLTLLNNWESTYFNFTENQLTTLMSDGKRLGVDLFLLDDGWFGNKYPRDNDQAGLGDWQANRRKLPDGIPYLISQAERTGIKFGIWIEPEMVNPKSELYENHPEWVLKARNRAEYYFRNQLVLDLTNPDVQNFVYNVVDGLFRDNPNLSFIKWDCNAVIYNAFSSFNRYQSHLYVEYVQGLYNVLQRLRQKYPTVPMMLCSGGGGRVDYGALQYFTEFWPSDNTDGIERVFIQWSYSYFFPTIATCNHVTNWGQQPLKYRTDVAMMGKLGYDLVVDKLSADELAFSQQAVRIYDEIKSTIWFGDLYRLVSPFRYGTNLASLIFVNEDQSHAIWFTYLTSSRYHAGSTKVIQLKGLDANKKYTLKEINIYPGTSNSTIIQAQTFSGDFLMKFGFNPRVYSERSSVIVELTNGIQILTCFFDSIHRLWVFLFYLFLSS